MIAMKTYVDIDPQAGYPRGPDLFYECQICRSMLSSMPNDNIHCACLNIRIDVEAGRMAVRDQSRIKLVRIERDEASA